ncbi:hypothetical protein CcaverHIS631_0306070 [Cutaneotrichosporon cavernicola]|nr:hypothetical protein CcaverHIS631_0306070 [Cutaneotrichosporon cavernicola]
MDMDARLMISRYCPTSYTPSPQFLRDPRLRTFACALLVVCLELNARGTMRWWMCEPVRLLPSFLTQIAFYHRLVPAYWEYDHTHLQAIFHRLLSVFKRRAAHLWHRDVRVARGGKMSRLRSRCSLHSDISGPEAGAMGGPKPEAGNPNPALHARFAVKGAPLPDITLVQAHPEEDKLERMESRDEESEVEVIEVDDSDEGSED